MIPVLAQAALPFTFPGMAIAGLWKVRKKENQREFLLRNVSMASAIVSLLTLQRAMLGTFGNPPNPFTLKMEASTGMGAFLLMLWLSIGMMIAKEGNQVS